MRAHDVDIPPLVLQVEADAGGRLWSLVLVSIVANLNTVYLRATLSKSAGMGVQEELRLFQWHSFNECEKMLSAV